MKLLLLSLLISPVIGGVLYRRQFGPGDVPPQCQDTCAGALSLLSSCTDPSCLCTQTSDTDIQQCGNCVIPLNPSLESTLAPYLQDFNLICAGLPPLTLPATTQEATDSSTPTVAPGVVTETSTTSSDANSTDDTVVPTETPSTAATNSPLITPNGSSTSSPHMTVTSTPTPPVANTQHTSVTSKSSTSVTSTSTTSNALFTATFSMFQSILLLIISTCALV